MNKEQWYAATPIFAQNLLCSAYGLREKRIRMGATFWEHYRWLLESEGVGRANIGAYQDRQIERMVRHAYENVPYYRELLNEHGLRPLDIRDRSDLRKLPVLRKQDVINHYAQMNAQGYAGKVYNRRTSGTTGTAMRFTMSSDAIAFQWAIWWRHRARFGIHPGVWHLNLTGKPVVPQRQARPPYWRLNWPMKQALINMQQIIPSKIRAIAGFLNRGTFVFYTGYPSIVYALAEQIRSQGLSIVNKPSHVFLGAENVQSYQKTGIEDVFGTKVTDQYGLSEGCANASKCEHGNYHEDWEFCHIECVDPITLPDGRKRGRIVGTGFANYPFPFIRYETGDYGTWPKDGYQCPCGRESSVIQTIEGRNEDYVITPEGGKIMRFDYIFKATDTVMEAQVIQYQLGEIVIKVVPRVAYAKDTENIIIQGVRDFVSPTLRVKIELVTSIERNANGKFRPVLSKLQPPLCP